jgi:transaldolase
MKFFVDTADVAEIRELAATGLLDGVTTNPSLVAKTGRDFKTIVREICEVVPGPVSAEVAAIDYEGMVAEGRVLAKLAKNVAVKVPLTWDGLKACKLAAKAGATFVSPFIGRLDDVGLDGVELIREIRAIYDNYAELSTDILAASIRTVNHVKQSAMLGADIATMPPAILKALVRHPLTDKGLELFLADWKKTGQKIV